MAFVERRDEARRFLELLWGGTTRSGDLGLFFIPGFRSLHLPSSDLDTAAHEIAQASLDEGVNVYLNTCLLSEASRDKPGRGGSGDALMIAGVWADVDIAGVAHKSDALPVDRTAALALCNGMSLPPTLVVDSGHGLYPWWLLDRPRRLADDDGRERARRLVEGAQRALTTLAGTKGWQLDHTSDLARILRAPGTVNWKVPGDPRPVKILTEGGPRYAPAELVIAWSEHVRETPPSAEPLPDRITAGNRTHSVASLAGTLRRRNVVEAAAMVAALEHNRLACDPPLPADKVRETVRGIYARYEPAGPPLTNGKAKVKSKIPAHSSRAEMVSMATIEREAVRFVWEPGIIRGGLTLLAGDPGIGKGLVASAVVAAITAGARLPGRPADRGSVLWISYEENLSTAICPRLDIAGADSGRAYSLVLHRESGRADRFFRPSDLPILEDLLPQYPDLTMIVMDPVMSFVGGGVNVNQGNDVRDVLDPLADLADRFNLGILGIAHVNKSELTKTLYRISNSVAFTALPRSVLGVGALEDGRRALAHIKASNTERFDPVPFSIIGQIHPVTGQAVGQVIWGEPDAEIDVARIFEDKKPNEKKSKGSECAGILREMLAEGPQWVSIVKEKLGHLGFGRKAIEDGLLYARVGTRGTGRSARWYLDPDPTFTPCGGGHSEATPGEVDLTESALRLPPPTRTESGDEEWDA